MIFRNDARCNEALVSAAGSPIFHTLLQVQHCITRCNMVQQVLLVAIGCYCELQYATREYRYKMLQGSTGCSKVEHDAKKLHNAAVLILSKALRKSAIYFTEIKKMEWTFIIKTGTQQTDVVLIQQNVEGSAAFNRSWNEFKVGFGNVTTNFWIGNDCLNQLTRYGTYWVKIEILTTANLTYWLWADYDKSSSATSRPGTSFRSAATVASPATPSTERVRPS